ncbi:MAG: TonB-dependent receptor [Burkholderiaceae bacterium]|nr:TonB-dependent receptor [Burkholderiaceae bacterium]
MPTPRRLTTPARPTCTPQRVALSSLLLPLLLGVGPALAQEASSDPHGATTVLAPVVVTGTRSEKTLDETPIRTEVVTREEIEKNHPRTLRQALEDVPGLQIREVHGKSGHEVSLQGLTSDQVLVLVDGLPITPSTGSTVDLSQYLLNEVDHIEVVKGATSAQYGSSAMGGVINVITRRIRPGYDGTVSADVGTRGSQNPSGDSVDAATRHARFRLDGGSERWRFRVNGDRLEDEGFAVDPSAWARQGDAVDREQYGGRLEWLPVRNGRIWIDGSAYREEARQRFNYFAPPNNVPQRKTETIERDRLGIGADWRAASGLRTEIKAVDEHYDSESNSFSNEVFTRGRIATQRMTHATAQVDLPLWYRQLWQFGADWHREELDQSLNGVSELGTAGSTRRTSDELFFQNDILFNETWELLVGGRWQDDSDFGAHAVPKVSVRARLLETPEWTGSLRASYGKGYRVPNLKERHFLFDHSSLGYMVIGNPDLRPEQSDSFQLGGRIELRGRASLDVNLFDNRVEDLIQVDEANAVSIGGITAFTYRNVSRARTRGVETSASWQAAGTLRLNAGYTLTDTEDRGTGLELTRRPRHMGRVGLDWQASPGTTVLVRARYQGSELVQSTSGGRSPSWTTVDLVVNQQVTPRLTVFAGVDNLFDRQRDFADPDDFGPLGGRFVYLGLRYDFGTAR